jgi:hypothetical protein
MCTWPKCLTAAKTGRMALKRYAHLAEVPDSCQNRQGAGKKVLHLAKVGRALLGELRRVQRRRGPVLRRLRHQVRLLGQRACRAAVARGSAAWLAACKAEPSLLRGS